MGQVTDIELFVKAFLAFVAFSLSASAVYIFNDYEDIKDDRKHPKKKHRPLASGIISKDYALSLMIILLIISFSLMAITSLKALVILGSYVILNIGEKADGDLERELKLWVRKQIGPIATPDFIQFTSGLPKTRSGKIMRRILRKIAENKHDQLGDTTTLADPTVVESLVENRKNR